MKETIYTIPINIEFEKREICPVCRLYAAAKAKTLDFITGAAMMEPDIRIKTNEQGFCRPHFSDMLKLNNRLSVSLMLESHLDEIKKQVYSKAGSLFGGNLEKTAERFKIAGDSCFVCGKIEEMMGHFYANIVHMWSADGLFNELYRGQKGFCLPHMAALFTAGAKKLNKREQPQFIKDTVGPCNEYLAALREGVGAFSNSYDYQNAGKPMEEAVRSSVDRAIAMLSGCEK